jgi:hypothetical protein
VGIERMCVKINPEVSYVFSVETIRLIFRQKTKTIFVIDYGFEDLSHT